MEDRDGIWVHVDLDGDAQDVLFNKAARIRSRRLKSIWWGEENEGAIAPPQLLRTYLGQASGVAQQSPNHRGVETYHVSQLEKQHRVLRRY